MLIVINTSDGADGVQRRSDAEVVCHIENNDKYKSNAHVSRNCNSPVSAKTCMYYLENIVIIDLQINSSTAD